MPEAVRRARLAFTVGAELFLVEDGFEKLSLPLGKNRIRRFGRAPRLPILARRPVHLSLGRRTVRSARRFPLESSSVPPRKIRSGLIGALRKLQNFVTRRRRAAHIVIHQQELVQLAWIQHTRRPNRLLATARRFRSRVGVERRPRHVSAARPPADTAAFV